MQIEVMANAKGRLLPFSLPFRFFLAACLYQLLMWAILFLNARQLISYHGGSGPILTAIHLLTLGVLVMTAVGASIQLLSVATRRPMRSIMACRVLSWFLIPGVAILVYGMAGSSALPIFTGAAMLSIALFIYAILVFDNLLFAPGMGVITAYIWAAIVSLCFMVALGITLIMDYFHGFLYNHTVFAVIHMLLAAYGFMGMLALGFSYILVPMFGLASLQKEKLAYTGYYLNVSALIILVVGLFMLEDSLIWSAVIFGLLGCICYLYSMYQILHQRMRKRLGFSFKMIYLSWCALPVSIISGAIMKLGFVEQSVFGVLLLLAWLFIFLIGILQRITPLLATMHLAQNKTGKQPTQSELTSDMSLMISNYGYIAAIALLIIGLLIGQDILIRIGSLAGLCACMSLLYFLVNIVRIKQSHHNVGTH